MLGIRRSYSRSARPRIAPPHGGPRGPGPAHRNSAMRRWHYLGCSATGFHQLGKAPPRKLELGAPLGRASSALRYLAMPGVDASFALISLHARRASLLNGVIFKVAL